MDKCPIFKGAVEGWCLRNDCRWFDKDREQCVYAEFQQLKAPLIQKEQPCNDPSNIQK